MANVIQMGEPKADAQSEVVVDSHDQQAPAAAAAAVSATAGDGDDVPGVSATLDAAEGTNGVAAGDETVVDEVSLDSCTDSKPASIRRAGRDERRSQVKRDGDTRRCMPPSAPPPMIYVQSLFWCSAWFD